MLSGCCRKMHVEEEYFQKSYRPQKGFKVFLPFKNMVYLLGEVLETHSEIHIFCLILCIEFQKQSMGNSVKVLVKCSETVFDEVHFIVKFHTFLLFVPPSLSPGNPLPQVIHLPLPGRTTPKTPSSLEISTKALVFIFSSILNQSQAN